MKKQHDCKYELNQRDLRATPARVAVMSLLEQTQEPLDAFSVWGYLQKKRIDTDPATVFRILQVFTQKGITTPVEFQEGKTRYELANKIDHHHLICENCGEIVDIKDTIIPIFEKKISNEHTFLVKRHTLEFFGLCSDCQR